MEFALVSYGRDDSSSQRSPGFEQGTSMVWGVHRSKFSRVLEGASFAFGVKFRPGAFRPFISHAVSLLTDRTVPAHAYFKQGLQWLEEVTLSCCSEEKRVHAAESFFRALLPRDDERMRSAMHLVDLTLHEKQIKTVDDLSIRAGLTKRTLQRLFREYVGVSPKWVIRRYRLHEVLEALQAGESVDWADLAVRLGYFDQAHLIRDFQVAVGNSPGREQGWVQSDREQTL